MAQSQVRSTPLLRRAMHRVLRRVRAAFRVWLVVGMSGAGVASAAAPCGALLGVYLEQPSVQLAPCLVDLQETALCFKQSGTTVEYALMQMDAYLQERGIPRPVWESSETAHAARFWVVSGDVLEVVLAADGPFSTMASCRIVPQR